MAKMLDKRKVDEVIRINKKYYKTGDTDYLEKLREAAKSAFGENDWVWLGDIITGITVKYGTHYQEPYATYYKVLEVLGYEIKEIEE